MKTNQKHNQRSCKMKKSTQTVPYNTHSNPWNLKKFLAGVMLVAVPVFVSCEKDPEPAPNGGNNQPQKHNVELRYNPDTDEGVQHLAMDTLHKYNTDPTVDSILLIPYATHVFATWGTQALQSAVNFLRPRHNVNPNKIFGKGELQLWNQSVLGHPEIVRFFADTLRYTVTYRETASKTR